MSYNILITAAGRGTRFLKEGIKTPKPLIKVLGIELLIWSLRSCRIYENNIFLVVQKKDGVKKSLEKKMKLL